MIHPSAIHPHAATKDQRRDAGAVMQIVVIPMIDAGADNDGAFALRLLGGGGEFAGELHNGVSAGPGELLLPGRRVGDFLVVVAGRVVAGEAARHAILRHQEIQTRGNRHAAVDRFDVADRHPAVEGPSASEIDKGNLQHVLAAVNQAQLRIDIRSVQAVFQLEVPLAVLALPAKADGALRHARLAAWAVKDHALPFAILNVAITGQPIGPQKSPGGMPISRLFDLDQKRSVGIPLQVVDEVRNLPVYVKFLEDDVIYRHPHRPIHAGVYRNPPIGVFRNLAEIRGQDHQFGAIVPGFDDEVRIRRPGHAQIASLDHDVLAVEPVRAFRNVGLLAPGFGRSGRKIGVHVVEAEHDATEELQEAGAGRVAQHGHRRNGREADHAVRAVFLRGIQHGGHDELQALVPTGAAESAFPPRCLILVTLFFILHNRCPGLDRICVFGSCALPKIHQDSAQIRILHPQRAVNVPGVHDAPLAPARLVQRQAVF